MSSRCYRDILTRPEEAKIRESQLFTLVRPILVIMVGSHQDLRCAMNGYLIPNIRSRELEHPKVFHPLPFALGRSLTFTTNRHLARFTFQPLSPSLPLPSKSQSPPIPATPSHSQSIHSPLFSLLLSPSLVPGSPTSVSIAQWCNHRCPRERASSRI